MSLHLIKLCVGAETIRDLEEWIAETLAAKRGRGEAAEHTHRTRMVPKRVEELLEGGSMFWVIKGQISARQTILDIRPFTRGHTLVIPKRHTVDLTDTPPETVAAMTVLGQRIARAARASGLHADGNNIAINDGSAAFQTVLHVHLHVVPRRDGDKLSFAKGLVFRRDPDRETTGRILREALAKIDAGQ